MGALLNVSAPEELMAKESASVPDSKKLIESESASVTVILAAEVWFSATVNVELDVKTGDEFATWPKTTLVSKPSSLSSATEYCLLFNALSLIKIYEIV